MSLKPPRHLLAVFAVPLHPIALDVPPCAIYGNHMKGIDKTTVYLDSDDYRRLKGLGRKRGAPAAELVREAVAEYVVRHAPAQTPKSVGAFSSGRRDLGERAEALLDGMGRDRRKDSATGTRADTDTGTRTGLRPARKR